MHQGVWCSFLDPLFFAQLAPLDRDIKVASYRQRGSNTIFWQFAVLGADDIFPGQLICQTFLSAKTSLLAGHAQYVVVQTRRPGTRLNRDLVFVISLL